MTWKFGYLRQTRNAKFLLITGGLGVSEGWGVTLAGGVENELGGIKVVANYELMFKWHSISLERRNVAPELLFEWHNILLKKERSCFYLMFKWHSISLERRSAVPELLFEWHIYWKGVMLLCQKWSVWLSDCHLNYWLKSLIRLKSLISLYQLLSLE